MALQLTIPNRPFSTEPITGLMMPDGFFEISLGRQHLNVHVHNVGAGVVNNVQIYVESVSHPGIVITPATHFLNNAQAGVSHLYAWETDFSSCVPGVHHVSFIVESSAGRKRIIKKIFVTQVTFNTVTKHFTVVAPEGSMTVAFDELFGPKQGGCCPPRPRQPQDDRTPGCKCHDTDRQPDIIGQLRDFVKNGPTADFRFCSPYYLPGRLHLEITPTPPFGGQLGDLPYQDPWWKVLLAILALILLIAAAIAEAVDGTGDITVGGDAGGDIDGDGLPDECCSVAASGGGTSLIAAGLVAAAAAVATAAAASDVKDPIRRGQENTNPQAGELTIAERLKAVFFYPEPVRPGTPFAAGLKWEYARVTTGSTYTYGATDINNNIHVLSRYEIEAPDVVRVYKRERFLVHASFYDADGNIVTGNRLFVQCFVVGPQGRWRRFVLQDHGQADDDKANDGIYSGSMYFSVYDQGLWTYYVIAQDVNHARPEMKPEEAATIIGGMVLTGQLTLTFDGGTCEFVPDGHVNVITGN